MAKAHCSGSRPVPRKVKKVVKAKRVIQRLRGSQDSFRSLLLNKLKKDGGRTDISVRDVSKDAVDRMLAVPAHKRAGYPVLRAKKSKDPRKWRTVEGKPVNVDFSRESWLPDDFTQGLKSTNKLACKQGGSGGTYTVYMSPEGRTFYHRWQVEQAMGVKFNASHGWNGLLREAELTLEQMRLDTPASFFQLLTPGERAHLLKPEDFHFGIVSARRTRSEKGLKGLATVHTAFKGAGVEPTWYVDADSLEEYRALGLKAVAGGKLTPARNMALRDARAQGRVCVQCSDDISLWDYRHGPKAADRSMDGLNAAYNAAYQFVVSPVTAVRFMLAKMRGAPEETKPRLGGVYCLGNCSRTMYDDPISRHHFIIGDFFVDDNSGLFFDEALTLKEDYDFTCQHLKTYGSVMRFMRLCVAAKHYSNEGGACSIRDAKGTAEQRNIAILMSKWPSAICHHGRRKNEVVLRWRRDPSKGGDCAEDGEDGEAGEAGSGDDGACVAAPRARAPQASTRGRRAGAPRRKLVLKIRKPQKSRTLQFGELDGGATLTGTGKEAKTAYIAARCARAKGKTLAAACDGSLSFVDKSGKKRAYRLADAKYDITRGFLALQGGA